MGKADMAGPMSGNIGEISRTPLQFQNGFNGGQGMMGMLPSMFSQTGIKPGQQFGNVGQGQAQPNAGIMQDWQNRGFNPQGQQEIPQNPKMNMAQNGPSSFSGMMGGGGNYLSPNRPNPFNPSGSEDVPIMKSPDTMMSGSGPSRFWF